MLLQQEKLPNSRLALYLEGVPKSEEEVWDSKWLEIERGESN